LVKIGPVDPEITGCEFQPLKYEIRKKTLAVHIAHRAGMSRGLKKGRLKTKHGMPLFSPRPPQRNPDLRVWSYQRYSYIFKFHRNRLRASGTTGHRYRNLPIHMTLAVGFYRAMYYKLSAKRGLAIACRLSICLCLSVCLSVFDVGGS